MPGRVGRVGQTQPQPGPRQPAERLLRRPAQQDRPHPNACLTCPDFQTTPEFLQIHRRQAAANTVSSPKPRARDSSASPGTCAVSRPTWTGSSPPSKPSRTTIPAMNRADNSAFLAQANARRHQAALAAAHHAIDQLRREGKPVTYAAVAHPPASPGHGSTAKPDPRPHQRPPPARTTGRPHRATRKHQLAPPAARHRLRRDHPPANREPLPAGPARPSARPPQNAAAQQSARRAAMTPAPATPKPRR